MKVTENTAHKSVEIDFEGVKPSEELRKLMKAYGFWWFQKEKKWIHTLEVDPDFFKEFVESRIRPLLAAPVKATVADVSAAVDAMSDADKQALLARLMGK